GPLGSGDSLIHTYDVVADTNGTYVLTAEVSANGTVFTTNTFELNVLLQAVPHVLETELTIRVAPGQIGSGSVTLTTDGDEAAPFTVTADAQLPVLYTVETQSVSRLSFWSADVQPDTVFNSWTETDSAPMDIGFGFTLFGTEYTSFSVSQYGFLTLSNTVGATAQLAPFQTTATVNQSTIRYDRVGNEQLVIAWGNDTGREFQLRLHADGTFDYLYEIGAWGAGTIGLSADSISQTINHSPGQTGNDALHLAPETWVSFSPAEGTLPAVSTRLLTFTADATAIPSPATYTFTATVDWGGTSDEIDVTVIVDAPYVQLDVPATVAFSGLAGYISPPAILTVTNSGNVPLTYSITDTGLRDAGYASESVDYQWRHIPETIDTVLSESVLDTEPVAIGFPFVFFGRTRTNLTVETDGTLIFDDGASITPYSAGLFLDGNAQIRMLTDASLDHFTVTWEKLVQPGGGEDQTFQAVLNRDDGTIRFNYMQLTGNWRDGVIRLTDGTTVAGTLINDDTIERIEEIPVIETTYVTNQIGNYVQIFKVETVVGTNTVITYTENANRQSLEFAPGQSRIITFSPIFGTIVVGATADITLVGNASSLTEGGGNTVTNDTLLTFCAESVQPLEQTLVSASDQYEWIRSVSNSDEWYLARLGGVAPRIPRPTNVYINGAYRAEKTPGELAWQTWGWGNNDPGVIDFDTIYIRSDNVDWDPDDRPADYIRKKPHSVTESTAVTFTATNSLETAYPAPAVVKAMWGTDEPVVKSQQNSDGSHTLSWPAAQDDLSRTYNVLYTTSLSDPWTLLDTVKNATSYVDDQHNNEPVIFYKVTVQ
ncbi:MAG: hypothetical protein JEZ10_07945, partial [Verrucomicrobia bacterium]|nr:hypothetical protein [Verrucomicrobiota bacterium]